jgi:hypothetical protein
VSDGSCLEHMTLSCHKGFIDSHFIIVGTFCLPLLAGDPKSGFSVHRSPDHSFKCSKTVYQTKINSSTWF